ncbi:MAG: MBL fold metallo-hydrolase [Synergistaceae bacterium]|nr:MBL fold metallo-hydrolase [Synergistaceae bacterium]
MKLRIHRRTGQIGWSILEVSTDKTRIMFDCGANLPVLDDRQYEDTVEIPGLTRGKSAFDALFIAHYHFDHCGLMDQINGDIPVYAGSETKEVLGIVSDFVSSPPVAARIQVMEPGFPIQIGDIRVLPVAVRHSALGAMMFLIESGKRKVLYAGDFGDLDIVDYGAMAGVDVMVCEGTNINSPGSVYEQDLEFAASRVMKSTPSNVFVLCQTANIDRIESIYNACGRSGRTLAVDPFTKAVTDRISSINISSAIGFTPNLINEAKSSRTDKYILEGKMKFDSVIDIAKRRDLVCLVRTTLGDFLRLLYRNNKDSISGGTLIYSIWDGYKRAKPVQDFLLLCESCGMKITDLNASGHAARSQMETAISHVRPRAIVPIHTESVNEFRALHNNVVSLREKESFDVEFRIDDKWTLPS